MVVILLTLFGYDMYFRKSIIVNHGVDIVLCGEEFNRKDQSQVGGQVQVLDSKIPRGNRYILTNLNTFAQP